MSTVLEQVALQKAADQQRALKQQEKIEAESKVHDDKIKNSTAMFKNTKITSCSSILSKNGQNVCLAFSNGAPKPIDLNLKRSSETVSISADHYKVREQLHAGMLKKPLEPYHPNAFRSRLPKPTVVMPYKNSSQIVIGDRSTYNKRQYVSTHMNHFVKPKPFETGNSGIIAETTNRWKHLQDL